MKVKELIEKLKEFNPETLVTVPGYESGAEDIKKLELIDIIANYYDAWYYGKHKVLEKWERKSNLYEDESLTKALIIY